MRYKQRKLLEQNIKALEDYIRQHNLDITPEYMMYCITEADPDQQQFKNSKWLIKNLLDQNFLWEDIESGNESKAFETLSRFLNIRKQWNINSLKDINQYVGLSGIAEKIRPFEITKGMNEIKREEKAKVYDETIVLYDKNDYLIVIPKTQEASCFWGRNTEWCTAATQSENYFYRYNEDGPLIICITPDNKKYQFHIDSPPMDENDKELNNIIDPVLTELALLTKKITSIKHIDFTNRRHCELAMEHSGHFIKSISPDRKDYEELCEIAIKSVPFSIQYILPINVINYEKLCKLAIQENSDTIQYIDRKHINNYEELCELAVKQDGKALYYVPEELKTKELCKLAVTQNGWSLRYVPEELKTLELCETAVRQNGKALYCIPKELRTKELCEIAIKQNGNALEYVPEHLQTKELCEFAVQQNGLVLRYILNKFKTKELCELAVEQNGWALQFVPNDALNYQELCEIAVKKNGNNIQYINKQYINNYEELCKIAVKQNGCNINLISSNIQNYEELCEIAVKSNGLSIKFINKDMVKNYDNLCELAVTQNSNSIQSKIVEPLIQQKEEIQTPEWQQNGTILNLLNTFEKFKIQNQNCLSLVS